MNKLDKSFFGVLGIISIIFLVGPLIVFPAVESPRPFGVQFWYILSGFTSFMLIFGGDKVRPYGTILFIIYCVEASLLDW